MLRDSCRPGVGKPPISRFAGNFLFGTAFIWGTGTFFKDTAPMQVYVVLNSGVMAWLAVSFLVTVTGLAYFVSYLNEDDAE